MGSTHFAQEEIQKASYFRNIEIINDAEIPQTTYWNVCCWHNVKGLLQSVYWQTSCLGNLFCIMVVLVEILSTIDYIYVVDINMPYMSQSMSFTTIIWITR